MNNSKHSNYLNKKELCVFLGVSLATINRHMKEKKLSFIKLGRRVFFDPEQVERDMNALQTLSNQVEA